MSDTSEELPFNTQRQLGFLGHVITNKTHYHQVKSKVLKNWFKDPMAGEVFGLYLKWSATYDKLNEKLPSVEEIQSGEIFLSLDGERRNKVRAVMAQAVAAKTTYDWDSITAELTAWLKCRVYLENVTKSTDLFNNKKYTEAFGLLETSVKLYNDIKFFPDDEVDFLDWEKHFDRVLSVRKNGLTTGLTLMDRKIDPTCSVGCLLPGDTTVLLAPTNVGKTSTMITMALANAFQGHDVLFITHEGNPSDIFNKMWANATNRTVGDLLNLYKTDVDLFRGTAYFFKEHITYLSIVDPDQMFVENVARIIERKQAERIQAKGKGYDLLVIDYPAKLQAEHSSKVQMQYRQAELYVYNYFVQLALKHNFHCLCAIQTNREASKNNRHQGKHGTADRLVAMEDVSEAWGPMTVATNVISINRNDQFGDRVIFHVCKTRSSETGISVLARSDYSRCKTHSNSLGGLWYKGNTSVASISSEMLEQFKNQCLPQDEVSKLEGH